MQWNKAFQLQVWKLMTSLSGYGNFNVDRKIAVKDLRFTIVMPNHLKQTYRQCQKLFVQDEAVIVSLLHKINMPLD